MRFKKIEPIVFIVGMIALFLMQGCDKDNEQEPASPPANGAAVTQVDMKVIIPVHPSSLKYFDYVVSYMDNTGMEYCDTIREKRGGITVDDHIVQEYEITYAKSRVSLNADIFYTKNFVYRTLPVLCRCEVRLVPKVSRDSVVSFYYIIPKPYLFSRVIFGSHSYTSQMGNGDIEGVETIKLDSIRIATFMSAYGSWFSSSCSVKSEYDGISTSFY